DAALAHAAADHPAGAGPQQVDGAVEALVELAGEVAHRRRLGLQHLGGDLAGGPHHGTLRLPPPAGAFHAAPPASAKPLRKAINDPSSRSARSGSSCTALSERACSGSWWTSRKTPSAPAATAARASGSAWRRSPPLSSPPPGSWRE